MQKILRVLIIIAMLITAYLLVLAWQKDETARAAKEAEQTVNQPIVATNDFSTTATPASDFPTQVVAANNTTQETVETSVTENQTTAVNVSTDMYDIKISLEGGDVVYAALKDYDATLDSDNPFVLLENNNKRVYVAQSALITANSVNNSRIQYQTTKPDYILAEGQEALSVPLTYQKDGVTITKTYTFKRGKYPVEVSYNINNASEQPWQGQLFFQIKRDDSKDPGLANKGALSMATYLGGAWGTPEDNYSKIKFDDFNDDELSVNSQEGWVAMVQHYFVTAWTPNNFSGQFFTKETNGNYLIGFNSQPLSVASDTQNTLSATLYSGPKLQDELAEVSEGLNKTVDYGTLWPISKMLFTFLQWIHNIIGNWGWAIICLTLLVKIVLMPISNKSYYSMAKMRAIAPRLQALKDEHGDDRMAMSQATMKLYKEEEVNPLAGCLPILLQMPIFLALYWVLVESVELRHAPWMLWIKDLSSMDPFFILPILMGVSMFVQQMFNPQPSDPMQAKVIKILPVIFTAFMLFFPAGLVLYWTVNNIFSMTQQYFINKKVETEQKAKAAAS